jgi:hypothetical protein
MESTTIVFSVSLTEIYNTVNQGKISRVEEYDDENNSPYAYFHFVDNLAEKQQITRAKTGLFLRLLLDFLVLAGMQHDLVCHPRRIAGVPLVVANEKATG